MKSAMASRKSIMYIYSKIFYGSQKRHKYFCFSRGSLYRLVKWNEPVIHFATYQLVTSIDNHFLCTSGGSVPSMRWKQSRPSPEGRRQFL